MEYRKGTTHGVGTIHKGCIHGIQEGDYAWGEGGHLQEGDYTQRLYAWITRNVGRNFADVS